MEAVAPSAPAIPRPIPQRDSHA
ncbi:hypothetical protein F0726_01036 [Acidithiobacillus caldus]|nr:hypothetical protein F0726_01036 [Acidithiobacillus caldus]